jgi:hypothetical protein
MPELTHQLLESKRSEYEKAWREHTELANWNYGAMLAVKDLMDTQAQPEQEQDNGNRSE